MPELSRSSFGEVGICGSSLLCSLSSVLQVSQVALLPFWLEWVEGLSVFLTLSSSTCVSIKQMQGFE